MIDDCPLKIDPAKIDFKCQSTEDWEPLGLVVHIGGEGEKFSVESYIDISTAIGGYEMIISYRRGQESWETVDVDSIRIKVVGQYERNALISALQRVGMLSTVVYGDQKELMGEMQDLKQLYEDHTNGRV
jgi:hypothetical protein